MITLKVRYQNRTPLCKESVTFGNNESVPYNIVTYHMDRLTNREGLILYGRAYTNGFYSFKDTDHSEPQTPQIAE